MTAIVILGMHRSGTSCLAGMLAAAGLASAGAAVRNWDNARGHHERLDVVRLNEAVLAHSGGHWLSPPSALVWTAEHEAARDRLLEGCVDGLPALLKDPRTLLTLPFWRASAVAFRVLGIVRHPVSVARSLESWRGSAPAEGLALWTAHNRALLADRVVHGYPLIDFDRSRDEVIASVEAACAAFGEPFDAAGLAAAYEDQLVHHDDDDAPEVAGLAEALVVHQALVGPRPRAPRRGGFPRVQLLAFERAWARGDVDSALRAAGEALASTPDPGAVMVPVVSALLRGRRGLEALELLAAHGHGLEDGLRELLRGKVLLALGDPGAAVVALRAACAVPRPFFQARHLLPHALVAAGHRAEARTTLAQVADEALYPHGPLSTLAEWCARDGDVAAALATMVRAIACAPPHRRGRLRARRAEWLARAGDRAGARVELRTALDEDPGYARSRALLAALDADDPRDEA